MDNETNPNPFDEYESTNSTSAFNDNGPSPIEDETSGRTFIWLILGVAAIACGLLFAAAFFYFQPDAQSLVGKYFPSPTVTFTPTPSPTPTLTLTATRTPTPTLTSTPTPNLTATQHVLDLTNTAQVFVSTAEYIENKWPVVLEDNFDSKKNGWGIEATDNTRAQATITIADGKYNWDITTHDLDIHWEEANTRSVGNFGMSVDAKQIDGPKTARYGIFFRESSFVDGYYFGINNKGEYFLDLYNGEWITLIADTKSKLILPNEYNRLTVIAEGSHFTFFINAQYLAEYTDERMKSGKVGLFSMVYEPNQNAIFEFDNFELRVP